MRRPCVLLLAALLTTACALRGGPATRDVLADLKEQFNRDVGIPRLVVLVSPT